MSLPTEAQDSSYMYDLSKDIGEQHNLADKYPDKVKELQALMKTFDQSLRANSRPCGDTNKPQAKPQQTSDV